MVVFYQLLELQPLRFTLTICLHIVQCLPQIVAGIIFCYIYFGLFHGNIVLECTDSSIPGKWSSKSSSSLSSMVTPCSPCFVQQTYFSMKPFAKMWLCRILEDE